MTGRQPRRKRFIDRYLDRSLCRTMAAQEEHNAALCLTNMDLQPQRADFWLAEAKAYAFSARKYRSGAVRHERPW